MTDLKAIEKSIKHWGRMIDWALNQPQNKRASLEKMYEALKEHWQGIYCDVCHHFDNIKGKSCKGCIIVEVDKKCCDEGSMWIKVNKSKTWKEWSDNAINMLNMLEACKIKILKEDNDKVYRKRRNSFKKKN